MLGLRLYMAQRLSALIMVPLVIGHIAMMIYAVQGGLTTAEILSRTQGNLWWFLFYGLFVVAVSVHAAIGMHVVVAEWLQMRGVPLLMFSVIVFCLLLGLGLYAVVAVTVI